MTGDEHAAPELADAQIQAIFDQEIVPHEFVHCPPQLGLAPIAVLVAERPGDDSGRLAIIAKNQHQLRGGMAEIGMDTLRTYHPDYRKTRQQAVDQRTLDAVDNAARRWMHLATRMAQENRISVVVRIPANRPAEFIEHALAFQKARYHVGGRMSGMSEVECMLGEAERYAGAFGSGWWRGGQLVTDEGRRHSLEEHKQFSEGRQAIAEAMDRGVVHAVQIPAEDRPYNNTIDPVSRQWVHRPAAHATVEWIEHRILPPEAAREFTTRVARVTAQHPHMVPALDPIVRAARKQLPPAHGRAASYPPRAVGRAAVPSHLRATPVRAAGTNGAGLGE